MIQFLRDVVKALKSARIMRCEYCETGIHWSLFKRTYRHNSRMYQDTCLAFHDIKDGIVLKKYPEENWVRDLVLDELGTDNVDRFIELCFAEADEALAFFKSRLQLQGV